MKCPKRNQETGFFFMKAAIGEQFCLSLDIDKFGRLGLAQFLADGAEMPEQSFVCIECTDALECK